MKDSREKIKLQFTRNCNFLCLLLKTVFMGAALTFSWPGGTSGYPGQKHGVNIIIPSSNQRVNLLHAARHHTSLSLKGFFSAATPRVGGWDVVGGFEGALTALPPHSLPLTLHLFPRPERRTEKTCLAHLRVRASPEKKSRNLGQGMVTTWPTSALGQQAILSHIARHPGRKHRANMQTG